MTRFSLEVGFFLGKKLCLKGEIEMTELLFALKLSLLRQNKLPKEQKRNLKSDLKGKLIVIEQINKLLRGIKSLRKSNFHSLSDKSQTNEVLLKSAFRRLLILLLLYILLLHILLLPFASDISSAWQIWQLLQQLLQFLFGLGPG